MFSRSNTPVAPVVLHGRFEQQVALHPRATAVECDGVRLRYRELNQEANRLARRLGEEGVGRDELVLVAMERSCDLIVGLLAILKAGGAFMLTDGAPSGPARDAWIRGAGAQVLLTDLASGFEARGLRVVGCYEASGTDLNLPSSAGPDDWACVIAKDGWTHRSILRTLDAAQLECKARSGDGILCAAPLDGTRVLELFLPLIHGARLVLASEQELRDPAELEALVRHARCRSTGIHWPTVATA